jgi:hypothetical protein
VEIAASGDDGRYAWGYSTEWHTDKNTGQVGTYTTGLDQYGIFLRFLDVNVPQGAYIEEAHLRVWCRVATSGTTVDSRIWAERDPYPAAFSTRTNYENRINNNMTTAYVNWDSIPAWNTVNESHLTPDISSVIQELVDLSGWSEGTSDIHITWDDYEDRSTSGSNIDRRSHTWDAYSGSYMAPRLEIFWSMKPAIGEFEAPPTVYPNEWFNLNATVNDSNNNITAGIIYFVNATIEINGTIILKWNNSTNTFSLQSDPNNYCSLNSSASSKATANSTAYKLSWQIKLAHNYTKGSISVISTNTKVYNSYGASGSNSQSNLFYFSKKYALNLRTINNEGNTLTEAIVYMDNGTQHNKAVNSQGWANWTDITSSTVDVYATWYDCTVNSTLTITMDEDKTIDIVCKAYPFVLDSTRYWIAGNATVSSYSWNQATKEFVITFGGGTDTYTLKSSASTQATYVLNCAFDMDTDWITYLTLTHDASRTITIAYPNWVSTRVYRADHIITAIYWASEDEKLYVTLFGTSGQSGTLEVYCGSRGPPESTTGLSDTIYFSSTRILAGTYGFGSTTTVELDWTTESSGSTGGTTTTPGIFATAENIDIGTIQQGASKNFNATATWSGSTTITLADLAFSGAGSNWLEPGVDFPVTVHRLAIETSGRIIVPISIAIPREARIGDYKVLAEYRITVGGQTYETRANILWTVTSTPIPPGGVPTIVSVILFVSLAGAVALSIKKK